MRLASEILACVAVAILAASCAGRASMIPNDDPALQKTAVEFAADAAKRHPFKADAPRGGEAVDLVVGQLEAHGMTQLGEHSDVTPAISRRVLAAAL